MSGEFNGNFNDNTDHTDVLINILNNIDSSVSTADTNNRNASIYVGIGSAANKSMMQNINGNMLLDPKYQQQFPPFLKKLKEIIPTIPLHIFLIDKYLESPPFIILNNITCWQKYSLNYSMCDVYHNLTQNIFVYCIRIFVKYMPEIINEQNQKNQENNLNLEDLNRFIQLLNLLSIKNNWFTVLADFTGKNMKDVAFYYDQILGNHIDHIIYGLGARKNAGCQLDVTRPECNFAYQLASNGTVKVFNPFLENISDPTNIINISNISDMEIIECQKMQYRRCKRRFIMIDLMRIVRQIRMLQNNIIQIQDMKGFDCKNIYLENVYGNELQEYILVSNYSSAFDFVYNVLQIELEKHLIVERTTTTNTTNSKQIDLICYEEIKKGLEKMTNCNDCYKWSGVVKNIIDNCDNLNGEQICFIVDED